MDAPHTRLVKTLRLLESDQPGEREAAAHAAHRHLKSSGMRIDQMFAPAVPVSRAWSDEDIMRHAEDTVRDAERRAKARRDAERAAYESRRDAERRAEAERAAERRAEAERKAAYRQAVIKKYGTIEAAKAADERQRAVDAAAAPFVRKGEKLRNGQFAKDTIDGWDGQSVLAMPNALLRAIRDALPFPTTAAKAAAEVKSWKERKRELEAIGGGQLSAACQARMQIVEFAAPDLNDPRWRVSFRINKTFATPKPPPPGCELFRTQAKAMERAAQLRAGGHVASVTQIRQWWEV